MASWSSGRIERRSSTSQEMPCSFCRVSAAASGEEGLAMIDDSHVPGLVITDIVMPGKSGLEVITEIRRKHPSVRIIAMSGGGRIEYVQDLLEKATELGADAVLSKPLNLDLLENTVERLLG